MRITNRERIRMEAEGMETITEMGLASRLRNRYHAPTTREIRQHLRYLGYLSNGGEWSKE